MLWEVGKEGDQGHYDKSKKENAAQVVQQGGVLGMGGLFVLGQLLCPAYGEDSLLAL